ncbi:MAG: hypothetical protein BGO12_17660 [Verrucomicrobia bacterium 61-8]|nr:PEP-CTERM sorting domain-containing protein [Verrucomicrobiota bacterium]OJU98950.1 MAG: hypothetical protein BGO12_17660 [Verrucomicrobia bacterium 61-8]
MIAGGDSDGSMALRSYSAIGTLGDPSGAMVVPEPSTIMMIIAAAAGYLLMRCFPRQSDKMAAR